MEIAFLSDIGKRRTSNQDYTAVFYNQKNCALVLLADGMGGHKAGDVASQMTVENLGVAWEETDFLASEQVSEWLVEEVQQMNIIVHNQGLQKEFYGMGTTLEAIAIFSGNYLIAHIGDSRSYVWHEGKMSQLTRDHSLVDDLYMAGEISQKEAENHPQKNIITRSIGMPGKIEVDLINQSFLPGDYLLLTSDGLTNMLSDEEISQVLSSDLALQEKVRKLIFLANENGGKDNITVSLILFDVGDV